MNLRMGEKTPNLLFMDNLKLYAKSERYLDSFVQTVHVFSSDLGMEYGVKKCTMVVIRREKLVKSEGIILLDGSKNQSMAKMMYINT